MNNTFFYTGNIILSVVNFIPVWDQHLGQRSLLAPSVKSTPRDQQPATNMRLITLSQEMHIMYMKLFPPYALETKQKQPICCCPGQSVSQLDFHKWRGVYMWSCFLPVTTAKWKTCNWITKKAVIVVSKALFWWDSGVESGSCKYGYCQFWAPACIYINKYGIWQT